ncbi:MAG: uridine kinase [Chloroflexota bacterium]
MVKNKQPLVIGIAGGSGSGKTTVATEILQSVGEAIASYIPHDAYYKDLSKLPENQRKAINFDHPNSLDTELMIEHIQALRAGDGIELPIYDFTTHSRTEECIPIPPNPVILVEGILIFAHPELRELFDVKLFVDTDSDIRLIRRIRRDISERGRTIESVLEQYEETVRPMHLEFVENSKRYADVIIPEGGFNKVALDMVIARIENLMRTLQIENQAD